MPSRPLAARTATPRRHRAGVVGAVRIALALASTACAHAEGPRVGVEYEWEKAAASGIRNRALTLKPGWEFGKDRFIELAELLIEHNEDDAAVGGTRARETKLFLRVRHNGALNRRVGYYVRGGIGRSMGSETSFTYGYLEPGLKLNVSARMQWSFGWREQDAVDGTPGERVRKHITGPSFDLDRWSELELRYVRSTRDERSAGWSLGFIRKF